MKTEASAAVVLVRSDPRLGLRGMAGGCTGIFVIGAKPLSTVPLQAAHAQQVVRRGGEVRLQLNASGADEACLAKATVGLQPAEDLLDSFALSLTDLVALVARRSLIQTRRAPALDPRDVRTDAPIAQALDEAAIVITLVAAQTLRAHAFATLSIQKCLCRDRFGDDRRADLQVYAQ